MMAAQSERIVPDAGESTIRPIELITENDFSIFRSWEINRGVHPRPTSGYEFLVFCPDGSRKQIIVEVAHEVVAEIELHTRARITSSNSFWICCAENRLADYVWEHGECPRSGRLHVRALTPSDLDLSLRWERT